MWDRQVHILVLSLSRIQNVAKQANYGKLIWSGKFANAWKRAQFTWPNSFLYIADDLGTTQMSSLHLTKKSEIVKPFIGLKNLL